MEQTLKVADVVAFPAPQVDGEVCRIRVLSSSLKKMAIQEGTNIALRKVALHAQDDDDHDFYDVVSEFSGMIEELINRLDKKLGEWGATSLAEV